MKKVMYICDLCKTERCGVDIVGVRLWEFANYNLYHDICYIEDTNTHLCKYCWKHIREEVMSMENKDG